MRLFNNLEITKKKCALKRKLYLEAYTRVKETHVCNFNKINIIEHSTSLSFTTYIYNPAPKRRALY